MKALDIFDHRKLSCVVIVTVAVLFLSACSSQESPFRTGDRATAVPAAPTSLPAAPAAAPSPDTSASTQNTSQTSAPSTDEASTPVADSSAAPSSEETAPPASATSQESGQTAAAPTPVPGTPTPQPTLEPTALVAMVEARQAEHLASLFEPSVGAVKLAEWDDKPLQFANALLGYILVYGYDFSVELVQMEDDAYQAAFQNGELDVMLTLDIDTAGDWYTTHIDGKGIVDLGSIRDGNGNIRLVVHSGLSERAPEVTAFLARAKPTDALIEKLSASIRGGRIGIKPTVPAIKFIKEQEGLWTQWVPVSVADKVKAAIAGGKTSLVNRKCIPDGGSGGGSNNCGT